MKNIVGILLFVCISAVTVSANYKGSYITGYGDYNNENATESETGAAIRLHAALLLKYSEDLSQYIYGSDAYKKEIQSIKIDLIIQGISKNIEEISDGNGLWIEFDDGNEGIVTGTPEGTKMGSSTTANSIFKNNSSIRSYTTRESDLKIGSDKVLLIAAEYWDWGENDDIPLIASELQAAGFDVEYKTYKHQLSGSILDFQEWGSYGLILISSHGFASSTRSAIDLNIGLPTYIPEWMEEDVNEKRLVIWQNGGKTSLLASNKFFEHYHTALPNTLIYMSACSVGKNSAMADAFINNNASSWIGYDDVVKVGFTIEHGVSLFKTMLEPGSTLKSSFDYGIKEDDNDPAEMILFASHDIAIVDSTGESVNLEQELIDKVNGTSLKTDGHFIHYDKEKFDWIYVDIKTFGVYKLEGMNEDGSLQWTPLDVDSFTSITMDSDSGEIVFGESTYDDGLEKKLSLSRYKPNGHFIHYGEYRFDWLYVDSTASFVAKLEGMKDDGSFNWLSIDISKFSELTIYQNGNIYYDILDNIEKGLEEKDEFALSLQKKAKKLMKKFKIKQI